MSLSHSVCVTACNFHSHQRILANFRRRKQHLMKKKEFGFQENVSMIWNLVDLFFFGTVLDPFLLKNKNKKTLKLDSWNFVYLSMNCVKMHDIRIRISGFERNETDRPFSGKQRKLNFAICSDLTGNLFMSLFTPEATLTLTYPLSTTGNVDLLFQAVVSTTVLSGQTAGFLLSDFSTPINTFLVICPNSKIGKATERWFQSDFRSLLASLITITSIVCRGSHDHCLSLRSSKFL